MPHTTWFTGSSINYAGHIFKNYRPKSTAFYHQNEQAELTPINWLTLKKRTASLAQWLRNQGVGPGDRVAAYIPNIPEAVIGFLATASLGAIWSSCSPDFGVQGVVERFQQIQPKVFITVNGYSYGGKIINRAQEVALIQKALGPQTISVAIPFIESLPPILHAHTWQSTQNQLQSKLTFKSVPFDHPLYILYSSGTTGIPKAIIHGHGGLLLEHLKYLTFHNDVRAGERFFWYTTTGWMMWNFLIASMLVGAVPVLYEGSPAYPDLQVLWRLAHNVKLHHFGTSSPYIMALKKALVFPNTFTQLRSLRSIGSTGSPLPPEGYDFVYQHVKKNVWLSSMSGGTDVCTAWVGGHPYKPVVAGEIQTRCLGCAMESWNDDGQPVPPGEVGEMVVTQPMPSMPVGFWNDPDKKKYLDSYFDVFPGVWRHGDWIRILPEGSLVILGRSDATLNRQGVRIGTAEIYRALETLPWLKDSLIVNLELAGGQHYMPLFVVMMPGYQLDAAKKNEVVTTLRSQCSPRHVPDAIVETLDLPYTISGKKLEAPVKKILLGFPISKAANQGAIRNPDALQFFIDYRQTVIDIENS
jgi:acetoacetyl-CoA synthetase